MHVRSLTTATFDQELRAATEPAALVDFYTTWCPPCRALAPALEQLAADLAGRVAFFKVNIEEEPELAERFQVRAVPTLAVFVGGQQAHELPGFVPPAKLRLLLERVADAAEAA